MPVTLISCSPRKPIFVMSAVYILEKDNDKFKIIESSTGLPIDEVTRRAPNKIIGLTQGKFKELKDKIINQAKEIKLLKTSQ